jgi:hypothetical protein
MDVSGWREMGWEKFWFIPMKLIHHPDPKPA